MSVQFEGVFIPVLEEWAELCHPVDAGHFQLFTELIDGCSRRRKWKPVRVKLIHRDRGRRLEYSDSPWLVTSALVFRKPAVEAMSPLLEEFGELLPLDCAEAPLWVYNPIRLLANALDVERSSVARLNGKIFEIEHHELRPSEIAGVDLFKLTNLRASVTYVSGTFVACWREARLKGLRFLRAWPNPDRKATFV